MIEKNQLRESMAQYHSRSNAPGIVAAAFDLAAYCVCLVLLVRQTWLPLRLGIAITQGMLIGRLFILGHDACHAALFRSRSWNQLLGRVFFLPSLTPYSLWEAGHNSVHHGFSNLKGKDYVWTPFSPDEWLGLSTRRRLLERFYRSPFGLGAYYLVELWWKRLFFPNPASIPTIRPSYLWDNVLNTVFLAAQIALVVILCPPHASRVAALVFAIGLPFALWNYLMSFAIYCHHNHPDCRWFDNRAEWSFYEAHVRGTTHTAFLGAFGWLLHNIFEHTAHHVDTAIPFYELRKAQKKLEALCGADVVRVEPFSVIQFWRQMRICQLYDYRKHAWMRFEDAVRQPVAQSARSLQG
jgi:omega-6 fatty acid desaturase (delta-12 desaturase)